MAPFLVLTELAPSGDKPVPTFTPDCTKLGVVRPFTFTTTLPALSPVPTAPTAQQCDASARPIRTLAGQWTGVPIRATVPLRRTRATHSAPHASPRHTPLPTRPPAPASVRVLLRDDADGMDENEHPYVPTYDPESDSEGEFCVPAARCDKYESITAAEGLDAWSFEELRVECYAQSLIARGTKPPPVVRPSLAIPPAFVARIVARN